MSHEDPQPESPAQPTGDPSANALPKAYDPSIIEQKWADYWVRERIFDVPTPNSSGAPSMRSMGGIDSAPKPHKTFTLLLPPPNVTGRLHMGHMLNQTEIDILIRWHRMLGETALWVPGTDHAGIATQMMVERQLASEGTDRKALGREAFIQRVWQWKRQYGSAITDQMKRLGASVDWSREYFTMDDRLSPAVVEAFIRLYEQGLIYRGAYIVNWDPVLQSAVSDLEVESEERAGHLYHIRYDLADGTGSITIATTRPETMLGDVAVAVNPNDQRYSALVGKYLMLPLSAVAGRPPREIPVIADDWAKPEFGTGAVKVTPAHDPNDFAIGQRHNLPQPSIMDTQSRISLADSPYDKLDRFEARKRIVADLEASGHLVAIKDHTLTIPISQRTGAIIEPRLSMQWFLAVNKPVGERKPSIAQTAIDAVKQGHIRFTPEMYEKTYFEWMNNIHDWCISRQLWWGHRIPAWHCAVCAAITVSRETPTACATCGSTQITQETDVLDTWFSSGLLPFTVFGWPNSQIKDRHPERSAEREVEGPAVSQLTPDLAMFYPTSLLITGFDILFFWVARMIMLGTHFMLDVPMPDGSPRELADAVPFKEVYIHALVRDANREKMSKTKGNVIDPIGIVEKYGTDAVRFTLASMASPGTDIAFSEARTEGNRAFANKIWNAARFLFMRIDKTQTSEHVSQHLAIEKISKPRAWQRLSKGMELSLESRWIASRFSSTATGVNSSLAAYRFDEAANLAYQFFWGDYCDWYLEMAKTRLDPQIATGDASLDIAFSTLLTLLSIFEAALRLLSPFMPFLSEEIWHAFYQRNPPVQSIALSHFPQGSDFDRDIQAENDMLVLQSLITEIRAMRKEVGAPDKEHIEVGIYASEAIRAVVVRNETIIEKMARVSRIGYSEIPLSAILAKSTPYFDVAVLYERTVDIPAERERLTKDLAKYEKGLLAAERQLGNEAFMAKAPAHIVEGLRKQAAETRLLYEKTKAALDALPPES